MLKVICEIDPCNILDFDHPFEDEFLKYFRGGAQICYRSVVVDVTGLTFVLVDGNCFSNKPLVRDLPLLIDECKKSGEWFD